MFLICFSTQTGTKHGGLQKCLPTFKLQRLLNCLTDNIVDRGAPYRQHKVHSYNDAKEEARVH